MQQGTIKVTLTEARRGPTQPGLEGGVAHTFRPAAKLKYLSHGKNTHCYSKTLTLPDTNLFSEILSVTEASQGRAMLGNARPDERQTIVAG